MITNEKKPVIVFGYDNWVVGGVEKVLGRIMEALLEKYNVVLVVPEQKEKRSFLVSEEIRKIELHEENDKSLSEQMIAAAKSVNAKVFIGNANLNIDFLSAYKELKKEGIKSIMINHYQWFQPYMHEAYLSKIIEKRNDNIKYPDIVVWLTNISSYLCQKSSGRKVVTIGNINSYEEQNRIPWEEREKVILTVARFDDPIKRLDQILSIFAKVHEMDKTIKLVVVGPVEYETIYGIGLSEELERLKIDSTSVTFEGEKEHIEEYYKKAKVFLFSSDAEGFGMVLNEAGCFGVPVVAKYYLGIEDIITDGENGYLFDKSDEKGEKKAANKIIEIISNKEKWDVMSEKSRELAKRFSKENIVGKWIKMIDSVCDEPADFEKSKYVPSEIELAKCIEEYEDIIANVVKRINRADAGQNLLNDLYQKEKKKSITQASLKELKKEIFRRILEKISTSCKKKRNS